MCELGVDCDGFDGSVLRHPSWVVLMLATLWGVGALLTATELGRVTSALRRGVLAPA